MGGHEGGRWDVGAKSNTVYLERISEDDERLFADALAPDEARDLAGLLTKFADKADRAEESDDTGDADKKDDSNKSNNSDKSDESDDADKRDDSDESED